MIHRFQEAGTKVVAVVAAALLLMPGAVAAQETRYYTYAVLDYDITIHEDTTFTVRERQVYSFHGSFHQGWRTIPHDQLDEITEIQVLESSGDEEFPLTYSPKRLDKEDPTSWGKYTTWVEDGATNIEWYYDLSDKTPGEAGEVYKAWTLVYTVHGGLAFYDTHDELYWDLFTDFNVPVYNVYATVHMPGEVPAPQLVWYTNDQGRHSERIENVSLQSAKFSAHSFNAGDDATIAVGWQKGLVDESAYQEYFWSRNWPYPVAAGIFILSILFCVLHWYYTERHKKGRGVIIPEYAPPAPIRPAMAELIVHERVSRRTWPATIVDLATHGYLTIEETESTSWGSVVAYILMAVVLLVMAYFIFGVNGSGFEAGLKLFGVIALVVLFARFAIGKSLGVLIRQKDYTLTPTEKDRSALERYEVQLLTTLFSAGKQTFSTKELRTKPDQQRQMFYAMRALEKVLYAETDQDTKAYERSLSGEFTKGAGVIAGVVLVIVMAIYLLVQFEIAVFGPLAVLGIVVLLSAIIIVSRVVFDARLSHEGHLQREAWLGFKLYLETAEKHRLANLTPDIFEKYLPYAMIFGVEKKWARAFSSLTMTSPSWYHGHHAAVGGSSFSAAGFAAGFSASFASTFASSGASGASGGGGSAGGGGGGGGGGAS
ncbi:DUF2207 domain-containing protein [Patescibacteria group bacterium]|nr:DUF2207 domain-containing protein [Patescibacteria group bacterium]